MKTLLKSVALTALITGFANTATANAPLSTNIQPASYTHISIDDVNAALPRATKIGIARLDEGRLITLPYSEATDWTTLNARGATQFIPVSASLYLTNTPDIDLNGQGSTNIIDQIRMTARDQGLDYLVIYGRGADANYASLGNVALRETGLSVQYGSQAWQRGDTKALLVDTYSGDVLGTVTTSLSVDFDISRITGSVFDIVDILTLQTS